VGEIKIGFVTGLETKKSVTENFLALLYNIQSPVGGVIEWDTFESGFEGYGDQERQTVGLPRNQSTLTKLLMLAIMYRISGVNTKGGVCVYGDYQQGERDEIAATVPGCRDCSCLSREYCHLRGMGPK